VSLSGLADAALPCRPEKFLQIATPIRLPTISFAATLGVVIFAEPLQRRFEVPLARLLSSAWIGPVATFLNEALVVTVAAQTVRLPSLGFVIQ